MADTHSKDTRSYNMSRIRSKNTKPEIIVRKYLFANGFRFLVHDKRFQGKPDIVLPKYRTMVLVHGCFWHGHKGCPSFVVPKTNTEWWLNKIERNIAKDRSNTKSYKAGGWKVIEVWECELKLPQREKTLQNLVHLIRK